VSANDEQGDERGAPPPTPRPFGDEAEGEADPGGAGVGWRRWARDPELGPSSEQPKASDFEFSAAGEWLRIPLYLAVSIAGPYLVPGQPDFELLFSIYAVGILAGFAFQLAPRKGWVRELAAAATVVTILFAACGWSLAHDYLSTLQGGALPEEAWFEASRRLFGQLEFPKQPLEAIHLPVLLVAMFGAELVIREGVSNRGGEAPLWGLVVPAFLLQVAWFMVLPGKSGIGEWVSVLVSSALFSTLGLMAGVLGGTLCACVFHGLVQRFRR